jgi:hypothetical protein
MKVLTLFPCISLMALLSLVFSYSMAESSGSDDVLLYTVKKDDTVWDICKIYVADPLCWKKLVEYNQLKNPKYLPPKSIIKIPNAWLIDHSATALVIAVEGNVSVVHQGSLVREPLEIDSLLSQQDVITSLEGTAMIKFADDSQLLLKSNSIIRMASLQFYESTQLIDTRVELLRGRVKAQVEKLRNENSHYEILTPAAIAAVRGTEFRVSRSENATTGAVEMRTELLEGVLLVSSDTNQQEIVSGQAVLAVEKEGISATIDLLPRPLMALNESQALTFPLLLDWQVLVRAVSYKVTLMLGDTQVWERAMLESELLIEDIDSGQYQLLIRGIDEQGFEGRNRRLDIALSEPTVLSVP